MGNFVSYINGNYRVLLDLSNGTKIRTNNLDFFEADTPESFDLKVTNKCQHCCPQCHENSTCDGRHGDVLHQKFFDTCHPYTEIAIGGGNPLEHPDLYQFLLMCKDHKFVPSMTIHQEDFIKNKEYLKELTDEKLLYGIGVSVSSVDDNLICSLKEFPNAVVHVIAGYTTMQVFKQLANHDLKILILGYKIFRRGKDLYNVIGDHILEQINEVKETLPTMIDNNWYKVVSFDNLAIKQLEVHKLLTEDQWNKFYMGDDGQATMFIDLVDNNFAVSSTHSDRYPLTDSIQEMFSVVKKVSKND